MQTLEEQFHCGGETLYDKRNLIKKMQLGGQSVVVKAFKKPATLQAFIYANWRASKAARSFRHAGQLLQRNIPTPSPVAYIEHIEQRKLTESY